MPIGLIWLITMQKVLKTRSNKSVKQHCLGSNQNPMVKSVLSSHEKFSSFPKPFRQFYCFFLFFLEKLKFSWVLQEPLEIHIEVENEG